jgi:hypothetical protein
VFGTYSDLASIAVIAADGVNGAIKEKDALVFADSIAKASRSKFSPTFSVLTDLATGRNVIGQETRNLGYLASRVVPIGAVQAIQSGQEGQPVETQIAGGVANYFGARANPLTIVEQLGEEARARGYSPFWSEVTPAQKKVVEEARPDLARQLSERRAGAAGVVGILENRKIALNEEQSYADEQFVAGKTTLRQKLVGDSRRAAQRREAYLEAYPDAKDAPDPKKPWEMYYAEIEKAKDGDIIDFEQVDLWRSQQSEADNNLIDENTGTGRTPVQQERAAAFRKLREDGYFDMPKYSIDLKGMTVKQVDKAQQIVAAARLADKKLADRDLGSVTEQVLIRKGYTREQRDVVNKARTSPSLRISLYRDNHKGTLAWLNEDLTYAQIKAIPNLIR